MEIVLDTNKLTLSKGIHIMYEIFLKPDNIKRGSSINSSIIHLRKMYNRELDTIIEYYRLATRFINNDHLLIRLLTTLNVSTELDIWDYLSNVETRAPHLSKNFQISDPYSKGKVHTGIFYLGDTKEILISVTEDFDIDSIEDTWEDMEPVKVLRHPINDLSLGLPNQIENTDDIYIMSIDIVMLAVQYRAWYNERISMDLTGNSYAKFLTRYVIPNMLHTQTDYVLFNMIDNLSKGIPNDSFKRMHPFSILNYQDKVERVLKESIKTIMDKKMPYEQVLSNIPAITKETMLEALQIPDIPLTRQVQWAVYLTRLNTIVKLIYFGGDNGIRANKNHINKLKINIKMLLRDGMIKQMLNEEDFPFVNFNLTYITNL